MAFFKTTIIFIQISLEHSYPSSRLVHVLNASKCQTKIIPSLKNLYPTGLLVFTSCAWIQDIGYKIY